MLYVSLALSALLLAVVNAVALYPRKPRVGTASALSAAAIIPTCYCTTLMVPALNALLVAVAGAVCWRVGARPRWFLVSSLVATVIAYALISWLVVLPEIREWERLKPSYPAESLADRLGYEDRARPGARPGTHGGERLAQFETRIGQRIEEERRTYRTWRRSRALERLHAGVVRQFIDSPGFGPARLPMQGTPRDLELDDSEETRPEEPPRTIWQPSPPYASPDPASGIVRKAEPDFVRAHDDNTLTFLNPTGFGYGPDRAHIFGFKPHRFSQPQESPVRWRVQRLELLSLLKYGEPRAYVSDKLPTMDELRDAPTRSLDAFEQEALTNLYAGEDVMVREGPDQVRMLGSIRAVKQCVRCHEVERGVLLGAFSYRLVREAAKD
jgi:hypothetical protein